MVSFSARSESIREAAETFYDRNRVHKLLTVFASGFYTYIFVIFNSYKIIGNFFVAELKK
ncbi:hypothetical protein DXA13_09410 [Clostridium sp. AM58-1XD]|nr:hypothetical protein DXA13_09410 [Clostridium sp. AM58-1XD]